MASIKNRGKNSYQITVSLGRDINNKKIIKTKTITVDPDLTPKQLEKELQKQAVLFESSVSNGTFLEGSKITFNEFVSKWLDDYAEKQLQPKTIFRYKEMLNTRILPVLGHIKLDKIQPTNIIDFCGNLQEKGIKNNLKYIAKKDDLISSIKRNGLTYKGLSEKADIGERTLTNVINGKTLSIGTATNICKALNIKVDELFTIASEKESLSNQTIKHHFRLISSILTSAVQWQLITSNPAQRVKPPKVDNAEALHYDEEYVEKMLGLLNNEPLKYKTMVFLALYSGCRLGELCGLEWCDINFEKNIVRIRQASQYLPGMGTFQKDPKNESSQRIIAMPKLVMELLNKYKSWWNEEKLQQGDHWYKDEEENESNFVFIQLNGKPIHPSTPTKWFKKFRIKNDLPDLKFHGLRHTNASLLIGQNVDVQTVAKRLGHSKATTTTNIYSHFLKRPDQEAADKLQDLFNKDTIPVNKKKSRKG